ncbi:MAG: 6-phosphogluconolactonase [bacterium]|nr:6-phosphogluconolactonase [bacterium]
MKASNICQKQFNIFDNLEELAFSAAKDFAEKANLAVAQRGVFTVVLSGGTTPTAVFEFLAKAPMYKIPAIPWSQVHVFWGDERYVPHEDPESNFHVAFENLLSKVPIPNENIHPIPTNYKDPNAAALDYAGVLKAEFKLNSYATPPKFDLVYLGLGPDGHTASLFPETTVVKDLVSGRITEDQWVVALWVEKLQMYRITLLPVIINNSRSVVFLVAGSEKTNILNNVITGKQQPLVYPVHLIHEQNNNTVWYVDKASVSLLDNI